MVSLIVLPRPKSLARSCSCSQHGNLASRIVCCGCLRTAPQPIVARARAATKKGPSLAVPRPAGGQWAHGLPTDAAGHKQGTRIKQLEAEVRMLRSTTSASTTKSDLEDDEKAAKDDIEAEVATLKVYIKGLANVSEAEEFLEGKRARLKLLECQGQRQSAKPLHLQLCDIQGKLDRKERALKRQRDVELPRLNKEVKLAQGALEKATQESMELEAEIEELRARKECAVA